MMLRLGRCLAFGSSTLHTDTFMQHLLFRVNKRAQIERASMFNLI